MIFLKVEPKRRIGAECLSQNEDLQNKKKGGGFWRYFACARAIRKDFTLTSKYDK
ncbi:hypothetical protein ACRE1U_04635 [Helicobacter himalayensis]|uniref:hypothetical protein n=1 Tax=Helicobacter himalayensis TaxID=1591088 RepID=UPI003D6E48C5